MMGGVLYINYSGFPPKIGADIKLSSVPVILIFSPSLLIPMESSTYIGKMEFYSLFIYLDHFPSKLFYSHRTLRSQVLYNVTPSQ